MPESVFGLPTHPLVVHAAVVLVPLAAIALIGVGWNATWRHRYYLPVMLLSLAGAAGSFLAQQTGGPLKRALRDAGKRVGNHPQQGQTAFIFALLLAGVCIALYVHDEYGDRLRARLGIGDRYRLPAHRPVRDRGAGRSGGDRHDDARRALRRHARVEDRRHRDADRRPIGRPSPATACAASCR